MSAYRRVQIDPYLSPCIKLKFKWNKELNKNPITLNLIEEKVGSSLKCMGTGEHFLSITPVVQKLKETTNKLKLREFCKANDTVNHTKSFPF